MIMSRIKRHIDGRAWGLVLAGMLLCGGAVAQVAWRATLDSTALLIGDQTELRLSLRYKVGDEVRWPSEYLLGTGIEVVAIAPADTTVEAQYRTVVQPITITSFDSGRVAIAPVPVEIRGAGQDSFRVLYTAPLYVDVSWVALSDSAKLKPIKDIYPEPLEWTDHLGLILVILAIVAAALVIGWLVKRPQLQVGEVPPASPHEVALAALAEMAVRKPWENGQGKAFQSALTEVLRRYLEGRFEVRALEQTTPDILTALAEQGLPEAEYRGLSELLHLADMVKFARADLSYAEHQNTLAQVQAFVERTKPVEATTEADNDSTLS